MKTLHLARVLLLFAAAAILFGCASSRNVQLPREARSAIQSIDGLLVVQEDRLQVKRTQQISSGLSGLIYLAMDAANEANAQAFEQKTATLDFPSKFDIALTQISRTSRASRLRLPIASVKFKERSSERLAFYKRSSADAVVFWEVAATFEGGELIVSATAETYPRSALLMAYRKQPDDASPLSAGNMIARREFRVERRGIGAHGLFETINEVIGSIAGQMVYDLPG